MNWHSFALGVAATYAASAILVAIIVAIDRPWKR